MYFLRFLLLFSVNPIERLGKNLVVGYELGRQVKIQPHQPYNIQELEKAFVLTRDQIPTYTLRRLSRSMRRR